MASNALGYLKIDTMLDNASVEDLVVDRQVVGTATFTAVGTGSLAVVGAATCASLGTGTMTVASATCTALDTSTLTVGANKARITIVADTPDLTIPANSTIGIHNLVSPGTTTAVSLPIGYTLYRAEYEIPDVGANPLAGAVTSTVAIGTSAAGKAASLLVGTVIGTLNTPVDYAPRCSALVADYAITTAQTATYSIGPAVGVDELTGGRLRVFLHLVATA